MPEAIFNPWPWYVSGPLIGLAIPMMLLLGGKNLGISSSFRHICAALLPKTRLAYLKADNLRANAWNLFFVAGLALGGFVATHFLSAHPQPLLPPAIHSATGAATLVGGGFLIGFGTRW